MARLAMINKANKKPKYSTRQVSRCRICGRPRGYMRKFEMCRCCFRKYASEGLIPGVTKSSW
jgi:small subunit ribosomal protein S14